MSNVYSEGILERNLHPLHQGEIVGATVVRELFNASCGDKIKVFLKVRDGVITEASWEGYGCAISQASADFWAEKVVGRKMEELLEMSWEMVPELDVVKNMPGRVKCAELPWKKGENVVK